MVFVPISCFFFHEVRAGWLLGLWFLLQFIFALIDNTGPLMVAWWAHIGGFMTGCLVGFALKFATHR